MNERSEKNEPISPADKLLKTSKKGDIQLTEEDLAGVSGGEQISLAYGKIEFKYKEQEP